MIKKTRLFCSFLLVSSTIACIPLAADGAEKSPASSPEARMKSWQQHVKLKTDSIFKDVKWTAVGPRIQGGKIESIWSVKKRKSTIYAGVGSGNLWKTVNNGTTWKPVFESESTFSVSVVTVCDKDPNLVWVGTGEPHMARSSFAGTGVFKSADGAKTWKHMGLVDTHHIGRVLIDPKDSNVVYVAALGHQYTYNKQRGLFKTTDGGKTWKKSSTFPRRSALWKWRWTRRTTRHSTLSPGSETGRRGIMSAPVPKAGSTTPPTRARPGNG